MTDVIMKIALVFIGFCVIILWLIRHGDYEEQQILTPGIYKVGIDIPPGRCDLIADSGNGNFMIKSRKIGEWTLGNPLGVTSGAMPGRFRNVTMIRGDILEINGNVKVMLSPPVPIYDLETETLGPGIYRFGEDGLPAAKYDFEVASGSGEIVLVDIPNNVFNIFQEMAEGNPHRPKTFDNVVCSHRYELWVNGSLQLKLKRSRRQPFLTLFQKAN